LQCLKGSKCTVYGAILDDALSEGGPDARERIQFGCGRPVQIDGRGRNFGLRESG
jgi:hypothetical protein